MPNPHALLTLDDNWRTRGLCRDYYDPTHFHPPRIKGRPDGEDRNLLPKSICQGCPVKQECLLASKGAPGIWGGLDDTERWQILGRSWVSKGGPPTEQQLEKLDAYWATQE